MEQLKIKNFLIIKKANFTVKGVNIIIGPQANGKSLIAKLLHFFKSLPAKFFLRGVESYLNKRELDKSILKRFEQIFPRYTWEGTAFSLSYKHEDVEFFIEGEKNKNSTKTSLKLNYSDNLVKLYNTLKKNYKTGQKKLREKQKINEDYEEHKYDVFQKCVLKSVQKKGFSSCFSPSVYVPASRSFFTTLQRNIFSFLAENIDIDPLLKDFGKLYENSRFLYDRKFFGQKDENIANDIYGIVELIINGEYLLDEDQDWIKQKGKRVKLINASSGQQESLPMLLVLSVFPFFGNDNSRDTFFIEEPEAHLFPIAQKNIVSLLSIVFGALNRNLVVTTHSPYILAAFNNLIAAKRVIEKNVTFKDQIREKIGPFYPIDFNDVSVYTIIDGELVDVKDYEYEIIGSSVIDSVSDHFEDVLNDLLEMEFGN